MIHFFVVRVCYFICVRCVTNGVGYELYQDYLNTTTKAMGIIK